MEHLETGQPCSGKRKLEMTTDVYWWNIEEIKYKKDVKIKHETKRKEREKNKRARRS